MNGRQLTDLTREALALGKKDRIQFIHKDKWIQYSQANRILEKFEKLLKLPQTTRMKNLALVSRTNNGKTTLAKRFCKLHPPDINPMGENIYAPVIMIECPPTPTEAGLYSQILHALYEDIPASSIDQKRNRVVDVAKKIQLRVLVIDELHNFATGSNRATHSFLNTLKFLMNELKLSIIGCGTKELVQGLSVNAQIQNRFQVEALPMWSLGTEYQRLLATIETTLPLMQASNLSSPDMAKKIFALSEGTIGETVSLVNQACEYSIDNDLELVNMQSLEQCGFVRPSSRGRAIQAL